MHLAMSSLAMLTSLPVSIKALSCTADISPRYMFYLVCSTDLSRAAHRAVAAVVTAAGEVVGVDKAEVESEIAEPGMAVQAAVLAFQQETPGNFS